MQHAQFVRDAMELIARVSWTGRYIRQLRPRYCKMYIVSSTSFLYFFVPSRRVPVQRHAPCSARHPELEFGV